jgi:hypothetical protein
LIIITYYIDFIGGNNEGHKVSYGSFQTSDEVFLDQGIGEPHHVVLHDPNESKQLLTHDENPSNNNTLIPQQQNYHYQ